MRYHYRQEVLVSVPSARLVYQFGRKGPDIRTDNPNFIKVKSELDVYSQTGEDTEYSGDDKTMKRNDVIRVIDGTSTIEV